MLLDDKYLRALCVVVLLHAASAGASPPDAQEFDVDSQHFSGADSVPRPGSSEGVVSREKEMIDPLSVYEDKSVRFTGGEYTDEEFHYRLMKPACAKADIKYPLVIFLHGAGERGLDNHIQLAYFPAQMAQPDYRQQFPCFVLAPQCRADHKWMNADWTLPVDPTMSADPTEHMSLVMQIIDTTLRDEAIDRNRIYLTGLSMGAFGAFDLAIRRADWFAAIAPICGAVDPTKVNVLTDKPIWIVHGDADNVVPVERSRSAVRALTAIGNKPVYVELPGIGHNSWTPAYADTNGLIPWMFRQNRGE